MNAEVLEDLKRRFDYQAWRGVKTTAESLFLWRFFISGNELPGWTAQRIDTLKTEGFPPTQQSFWRRTAAESNQVIRLDVYECTSRAAAYEFLVVLLGEYESALITRSDRSGLGDVAFSGPEETSVVFARANL